MTNLPTNNEWIDTKDWIKNSFAYYMEGMPTSRTKEERDNNEQDFRDAIMKFIPKPTEVVSPVDIDKIINDINKLYGIEEMIYQKEVKKIIKKHLKGTTLVEPINQESEVVQGEVEMDINSIVDSTNKCPNCKTFCEYQYNYCHGCGAKIRRVD